MSDFWFKMIVYAIMLAIVGGLFGMDFAEALAFGFFCVGIALAVAFTVLAYLEKRDQR